MATAFLSRIVASARALLACFAPARPVTPAAPAHSAQAATSQSPVKPLRVVRVIEPTAPRSIAGRMVISGRLADVCAELERLVALEAQGC